jgi:hypothetical protein
MECSAKRLGMRRCNRLLHTYGGSVLGRSAFAGTSRRRAGGHQAPEIRPRQSQPATRNVKIGVNPRARKSSACLPSCASSPLSGTLAPYFGAYRSIAPPQPGHLTGLFRIFCGEDNTYQHLPHHLHTRMTCRSCHVIADNTGLI